MEYIKNILMMYVTVTVFISFIPQIIKLYNTKSSEDISLSSWILWVSSAFAYTVFSFLEGGFGLILASTTEFALTSCVLFLSVKYKNRERFK